MHFVSRMNYGEDVIWLLRDKAANFQLVGVSPCRQVRKLTLTHCRGVRRIVHCLNMLLCVQAPNEQYLATVQHGSLLRANFQFDGALNSNFDTAQYTILRSDFK